MFFRGKYQQVLDRDDLMDEEAKSLMVNLQPHLDIIAGSHPFRLMFRQCENFFKEIDACKEATKDFRRVTTKKTYLEEMPKICADAEAWLKENPYLDSVSIRIKIQSIHDAYLELNKKQQAKQQEEQAIRYALARLEHIQKTRFIGHFEDKFHGIRITFNLGRDDLATVIDYFRMRLADNSEAEESWVVVCSPINWNSSVPRT